MKSPSIGSVSREGLKTGQVKPGQVFFSTFMGITFEILDVS